MSEDDKIKKIKDYPYLTDRSKDIYVSKLQKLLKSSVASKTKLDKIINRLNHKEITFLRQAL